MQCHTSRDVTLLIIKVKDAMSHSRDVTFHTIYMLNATAFMSNSPFSYNHICEKDGSAWL